MQAEPCLQKSTSQFGPQMRRSTENQLSSARVVVTTLAPLDTAAILTPSRLAHVCALRLVSALPQQDVLKQICDGHRPMLAPIAKARNDHCASHVSINEIFGLLEHIAELGVVSSDQRLQVVDVLANVVIWPRDTNGSAIQEQSGGMAWGMLPNVFSQIVYSFDFFTVQAQIFQTHGRNPNVVHLTERDM